MKVCGIPARRERTEGRKEGRKEERKKERKKAMPAAGAVGAASALTTRNVALYGLVSSVAAVGVVVSAFRQRANFYSAAVMLGSSNGCMLVLFNFGLFLTVVLGKACQGIFFGSLRAIEIEHLYERSWYAVTESLLAMTMFRDEFDSSFVILFATLLFLKVFHWLSSDRVEFMEQSPSVPRLFHARMISILWTLFWLDTFLVAFAVEILIIDQKKVGIMIMFASEVSFFSLGAFLCLLSDLKTPIRSVPPFLIKFMILWATLNSTVAKYLINCYDLRSEEPWEGKSMYVFFVDLVTDFLKLATYLGFCALIVSYYGLPLNIIRDVYITGRSFFGRIRDFIKYRAATRNMDTRFPDATHQDMRTMSDGTCIICREEMIVSDAGNAAEMGTAPTTSAPPNSGSGLNETPKKLPCGHIFHFHCLRSWLERQQSCPTCRRTVFEAPAPAPAASATNAPPGNNQARPEQPGGGGSAAAAASDRTVPGEDEAAANPAQTARDRLQSFLQQLQTDAQRAREQGDRSAREASAAAAGAGIDDTHSRSATPRAGPSASSSGARLRHASSSREQVPPASRSTSRPDSPSVDDKRARGRESIRQALIRSLFPTSAGVGASSASLHGGLDSFGLEPPPSSSVTQHQNAYGVGPSLNASFATAPKARGRDGSETDFGPSWVPPPPWTFRPPLSSTHMEGDEKVNAKSAAAAGSNEKDMEKGKDPGEGRTEREETGKEGPVDPLDAREAARMAALKRFEALGKGKSSTAASTSSRSVTMPISASSDARGGGKAGSQQADTETLPGHRPEGGLSPAHEERLSDLPGNPALIPLFDPATVPSFSADSLPLPLVAPLSRNEPYMPNVAFGQQSTLSDRDALLDAKLSDAELARLSKSTRQGLEERLRLLERVQNSIWVAVEELSRALSVLPDSDSNGVAANGGATGQEQNVTDGEAHAEPASEPERVAETEPLSSSSSSSSKGKERAT